MKKNKESCLINIPFISRSRRFFTSCLNWGTFYFLFMIAVSVFTSLWWLPFPFIIFFGVFIYFRYRESRNYIVKILYKDNVVIIDYFDGNEAMTREVPRNELKVKWYTDTIGNFSSAKIELIWGEDKIIQYNIGEWNKQIFNLIYSKLK